VKHLMLVILGVVLGVAGCKKEEDPAKGKRIAELEGKLQLANQKESALKDELALLHKRVTRLQNDFKIYSQKPCDYELDPIEYTLEKKGGGPVNSTARSGMTGPAQRPAPKGPPAELKDVKTKARMARRGIKKCYQSALKKNTALQSGSRHVALKFTVLPSGRMSSIMIVPPIGSGFEGCVRSLLSQWHFARFRGAPQRFRVPMTLRPQ